MPSVTYNLTCKKIIKKCFNKGKYKVPAICYFYMWITSTDVKEHLQQTYTTSVQSYYNNKFINWRCSVSESSPVRINYFQITRKTITSKITGNIFYSKTRNYHNSGHCPLFCLLLKNTFQRLECLHPQVESNQLGPNGQSRFQNKKENLKSHHSTHKCPPQNFILNQGFLPLKF
jgi:hypothetical protein